MFEKLATALKFKQSDGLKSLHGSATSPAVPVRHENASYATSAAVEAGVTTSHVGSNRLTTAMTPPQSNTPAGKSAQSILPNHDDSRDTPQSPGASKSMCSPRYDVPLTILMIVMLMIVTQDSEIAALCFLTIF
jgi:hypothetical protein